MLPMHSPPPQKHITFPEAKLQLLETVQEFYAGLDWSHHQIAMLERAQAESIYVALQGSPECWPSVGMSVVGHWQADVDSIHVHFPEQPTTNAFFSLSTETRAAMAGNLAMNYAGSVLNRYFHTLPDWLEQTRKFRSTEQAIREWLTHGEGDQAKRQMA